MGSERFATRAIETQCRCLLIDRLFYLKLDNDVQEPLPNDTDALS
jgi:hypothetical protein